MVTELISLVATSDLLHNHGYFSNSNVLGADYFIVKVQGESLQSVGLNYGEFIALRHLIRARYQSNNELTEINETVVNSFSRIII